MRGKILALVLVGLVTGKARAQEAVNTGSVQDIYNHLAGVIDKAQSIDFHGTHLFTETEIESQFCRSPAGKAPETMDADLRFRARGTKYDFTERYTEHVAGASRANELAWDGKYYQVLTLKSGYLLISKQNPDRNHLRLGVYNALGMFHFLLPQAPAKDLSIGWDLVKNLDAWKACLGSARLIGPATFQGRPCSVVAIPNVEYRSLKVPRCTYTVYFSWNDGMFPIAWKIEDEYHRVLADYTVEEFGQETFGGGQVFYYPKKAKGTLYPDRGFPPGQPRATYTSQFESFRINTIENDDPFTINRAGVQEVYNRDTETVTAVNPVHAPDGTVIRPPD